MKWILYLIPIFLAFYFGFTTANKKDIKIIQETQQVILEGQDKLWNDSLHVDASIIESVNRDYKVMDRKLNISMLADKTSWYGIGGGNYLNYQALWKIMSQESVVQGHAQKEIVRINALLRLSYPSVERIPLCKHGENDGNRCIKKESKDDLGISNVVSQLAHPTFWVSRVKSAYLLQYLTHEMIENDNSTTWKEVLDSLYKVFEHSPDNKNNLVTRYMAWEAFRRHTCHAGENELFDVENSIVWWKNDENKTAVLNSLKLGRESPFCN